MHTEIELPPPTNRGVTLPETQNIVAESQTDKPKVFRLLQSVDWITLTIKRSSAKNNAYRQVMEFLEDSQETGSDLGSWAKYGYEGLYCNGLRWGRRETDDIIQLSSDTAGLLWRKYLPYADNVSRLDLAVTIEFIRDENFRIKQEFQRIQRNGEDKKLGRTYVLIEGVPSGSTLYVGSRSSAQFGRWYDKQSEAKKNKRSTDWFNCLRWEVEFKDPVSNVVAQTLARPNCPDNYIISQVADWFQTRAIWFPDVEVDKVGKLEVPRKEMPDEKRMAWLRKQVAPTIRKLLSRMDAKDIAEALSLPYDGIDNE